MKTKFKPGPWHIEKCKCNHHCCSDYGVAELGMVQGGMTDIHTARLIASAPDMYSLITEFGDAVTDVFEQMMNGNWVDDNGHDIRRNKQMMDLMPLIQKAIIVRTKVMGGS